MKSRKGVPDHAGPSACAAYDRRVEDYLAHGIPYSSPAAAPGDRARALEKALRELDRRDRAKARQKKALAK